MRTVANTIKGRLSPDAFVQLHCIAFCSADYLNCAIVDSKILHESHLNCTSSNVVKTLLVAEGPRVAQVAHLLTKKCLSIKENHVLEPSIQLYFHSFTLLENTESSCAFCKGRRFNPRVTHSGPLA